jgi:hypothetical protein
MKLRSVRTYAHEIIIGLVALIASAALVLAALAYNDSRHDAEDIRKAQVTVCALINEPVRLATIALIDFAIVDFRAEHRDHPHFHKWRSAEIAYLLSIRRPLDNAPTCDERFERNP